MFFIYQIIVLIILIISPLILIFRIIKNKEDKKRFIEKLSLSLKKRNKGNLIWFHGASVGEILSVIPLIKKYEKNKSINQILVTTNTLSSSKILEKYKFKKTIHQFYPIDYFILTSKFLNYWKPSVAIFIDSEIWPSMFKNIKKRKIPLVLINARFTSKTIYRWNILKDFTKSVFSNISIAYPQNLESNIFLKKINVCKVKFIGNLKFVENYFENNNEVLKKLKILFKGKKIWVASSTHNDEEVFCAKTHIELKKKIKNLLTIIIPRHIHRAKDIVTNIKKFNLNVALHTQKKNKLKDIDIYIVDTFGETNKFHKISSSVFLGGSIANRGGQNPLEAARHGARIFHGPNIHNFKDVYKLLNLLKVAKQIYSPKKMARLIVFNKNKKTGIKIKKIGTKIIKKTIIELDNLINNEFKKT